jgi:hypothetical protein
MASMNFLRRCHTPGTSVISEGGIRMVTCASFGSIALIAAAPQSLSRYCSSM